MPIISCQGLHLSYGRQVLLDDANLTVEPGERVALLGRNGEGKSTLLRVISGATRPDSGVVARESGARISMLEQDTPADLTGAIASIVRSGLIDANAPEHQVQRLCSVLQIDPAQLFETLSGGQKRRALLGRALACEPDLLVLDEPTNHLDLDGIRWLEGFLTRLRASVLLVTHDRAFLQALATRIVELDRGHLTSWGCDYPTFLERREARLGVEERDWAEFDRKLAKEETWIRQGIKARRTRNEGRVRALEALREQRAARRERIGETRIRVQEGGRSAARVMTADHVDFAYPSETPGESVKHVILKDFSTTIYRGDKVGIIGPNACGKTTLLSLLLGNTLPQSGFVRRGGNLEIAYFDQHRVQLDGRWTVAHGVADGNEFVTVDGEKKHVFGYLADFLFSPERARQPIGSLSGGERNRLLLARLFTQPANVLVLDEPTNDLDAETLEILEARLVGYEGTVLTVSHDRAFLDNLCTSTLVFEGDGRVKEYVGGYSDWQRTIARREETNSLGRGGGKKAGGSKPTGSTEPTRRGPADASRPKKLSFKERQEWSELPARIEALEGELEALHARMGGADFFREAPEEIRRATERSQEIPGEIETAFERLVELDERA
jgi:ATP-binding cassette subfamily F protein uup